MPRPRKTPEASPSTTRLLTKVQPPVAASSVVRREGIVDRVLHAVGVRMVVLRAPAGFGKTTLMRQLHDRLQHEGTPCAWMNLDESDNDPSRFLTWFGFSLQSVVGASPNEVEQLKARSGNTSEFAFALMSRLENHREPMAVFFDEFEAIRNESVLGLIRYGSQHLPQGSLVVIGSRVVPDLGLSRLRAQGQLLEIGPAELRLSAEEAGEFLTRLRGLNLSPEVVSNLQRSTEGWAAAIWLAAAALKDRPDPAGFVSGFAGSNAAIADYLAEEVLATQPQSVRNFLLQTSVLDQLDADACNAICQRNDSKDLLRQIERSNLFLVPLNDARSTFRYHGLFRDFLLGQLKQSPEHDARHLHVRAAEWFLSEQRSIPAIDHLLAADEIDAAIKLILDRRVEWLSQGRLRLLTRWLDRIPRSKIQANPQICMAQAWANTFTRGPQAGLDCVEGIESFDDEEAEAQRKVLRPMAMAMMDRVDEAQELGAGVLDQVKSKSVFAQAMLSHCLGNCCSILGHFADARYHADQAVLASQGRDAQFQLALAESVSGAIDLMQGRLRQAQERFRLATRAQDLTERERVSQNAFPGILYAIVLYEVGEIKSAERLLGMFGPMAQSVGLVDQMIMAQVLLARLRAAREGAESSIRALTELESAGKRLGLQRAIYSARLERARALTMSGNFPAAKDQLQLAGDADFWTHMAARHFVANDVLSFPIEKWRWMVRSGAHGDAIAPLKQAVEEADHQQRHRRSLKLRILLAEALHRDAQKRSAMRMLSRAVEFAQTEGFVQTFLEEGPYLRALLEEIRPGADEASLPDGGAGQWLSTLLKTEDAVASAQTEAAQVALPEPLSKKETRVLHLLGEGLSNSGIAERMFVSENTVRTHLRNINVKLQASSRTQAVVIARRLKLIV